MSDAASKPGDEFGPYTMVKLLGEGGMAVTFVAKERLEEIGGERVVAIKQILPSFANDSDFRRMFLDEARLSTLLNHQNICKVYTAGEVDGALFMAMEFIDGIDLARLNARGQKLKGGFPVPHALHICDQVLNGLHAAHAARGLNGEALKLVHRDVSPQNVVMSKQGEVKVIDFGVAKARTNNSKTAAGIVKGKVLYYSPEQLQAMDLDGRSDLFAVGLILYELVTGVHPLAGATEIQTIHNYYQMEIAPPSSVRPELPEVIDRVIMRALTENRDERFASADEMSQAVSDALFDIYPSYRQKLLREFIEWSLGQEDEPYIMPESRQMNPASSTSAPEQVEASKRQRSRMRTMVEEDLPSSVQERARELLASHSNMPASPSPPPSPFAHPGAAAPPSSGSFAASNPEVPPSIPTAAVPHEPVPEPPPRKKKRSILSYIFWYTMMFVLGTIAVGCLGFFGLFVLALLFGDST